MYKVKKQSFGELVDTNEGITYQSEAEGLAAAVNTMTDFLDKEYPRKRTHVSVSFSKDRWEVLGNAYSTSQWWRMFVIKI